MIARSAQPSEAGSLRWPWLSAALLLALACAAGARAEPQLEVAGSVLATTPQLRVRVVVTNRGRQPVSALEITGELLGQQREARLPAGIAAGANAAVILCFAADRARPGVHALVLLLEHPVEGAPDAAGNPPVASQRAWLLVALGASAEPAVRLLPQPARLDVSGGVELAVESADGAAHRVRLRALPARGLRSEGRAVVVDVPASGRSVTTLRLVRAGAPRGTRHAVLLVAEVEDGPLARTSVATANVDVVPDPSLLPRWRPVVLASALLLLGLALASEAWLRARRAT